MGLKKNNPGCGCCGGVCLTCLDASNNPQDVTKWTVVVSGYPTSAEGPLEQAPSSVSCSGGSDPVYWEKVYYTNLDNFNCTVEAEPDGSGGCSGISIRTNETQQVDEWDSTVSGPFFCPTGAPSYSCPSAQAGGDRVVRVDVTESSGVVRVSVIAPYVPGVGVTFDDPTCAEQTKTVQTSFDGVSDDGCADGGDDIEITIKLTGTT